MQRYSKKILILGGLLIALAVVGCCKKQQARIVELEKEVSFAEGSKKETEAERDKLLADVDKLNAEKEALGADIEKLTAEKKEVEDQLNSCNETIKAVEYQKEQIEELKKTSGQGPKATRYIQNNANEVQKVHPDRQAQSHDQKRQDGSRTTERRAL